MTRTAAKTNRKRPSVEFNQSIARIGVDLRKDKDAVDVKKFCGVLNLIDGSGKNKCSAQVVR